MNPKLVTGIEAIQSGKPFRYKYKDGTFSQWLDSNSAALSFFPWELTDNTLWEIKQEPREWWIKPSAIGEYVEEIVISDVAEEDDWIKVREVLDDEA